MRQFMKELLRIGQTSVTHGYLMSKEKQSSCNTYNVHLSTKHLWTKFRKYQQKREESVSSMHIHEILD